MNAKRTTATLRRRSTLAILAAAVVLPLTASATTTVVKKINGAIHAQAGDKILLQTVAQNPAATRMNVTATVDNGEQVEVVQTQCQLDDGSMQCQGLGSVQMTPMENSNTAWVFDPADLGLLEWNTEVVPEAVTSGWFGCELELNDFSDCRNTCQDLYPGTEGAAITSIGPGCTLMCTCYNDDGGVLGTFPGNDTVVLGSDPEWW